MKFPRVQRILPSWKSLLLAVLSAVLLILAFPDFEYWFLAWFALVPLLLAVEREKDSIVKSFVTGWLFGAVFFFGTCWWLAYAPIHYAAFPPVLAYLLVFCATAGAAVFPGLFGAMASRLIRDLDARAYLAIPFVWVATEFTRYWVTGNDWNAVGYSQAFIEFPRVYGSVGGVTLVSFICVLFASLLLFAFVRPTILRLMIPIGFVLGLYLVSSTLFHTDFWRPRGSSRPAIPEAQLVAVQPNVPMSGLNEAGWQALRQRQIEQAETALRKLPADNRLLTTVVLPESPMNFQWAEDTEFQQFISQFAAKNNVSVLFNSAEPDRENNKYFNSAVMIDPSGQEVVEYDKIYLLPFGEAVPAPLESLVPGFVGNFSYGRNYNLVPLGGDTKAGIMICFESHFGQLSREYVLRGADAIIEMTNDGYLGPTPVLRQHLANAVFRAIETNRPVLRVTNVGITAYINERGEVMDATRAYTEDTRIWTVEKSDGSQTFYVRYGDWFAWLCSAITIFLLIAGFVRRRPAA